MFNEIFEIPVYRLSRKKRSHETEAQKEKYFQSLKKIDANYWTKEKTDLNYEKSNRKCWDYNEIIGYIKVYVDGHKIHGEWYTIVAKSFKRNSRNKKFVWMGKSFETWIWEDLSNQEILKEIIRAIKIQTKSNFKRRYLELIIFRNIGKYIDWRSLCGIEH